MARKVVRNVNGVHGREPLHNDASHGSDAFQCLAVCAKQPQAPPPPAPPRPSRAPTPGWGKPARLFSWTA